MAFATVIHLEMNLEGNRKIVCGQTTSDSTDGNIETGLSLVESLVFTHKGTAEASGDVAIHCVSGDVVYFMAIGQ